MEKQFVQNLRSLWFMGLCLAAFLFIFAIMTAVPFIYNVHIVMARRGIYIAAITFVIAIGIMFFAFFSRHKYNQYRQGRHISNKLIYSLIIILYTIIMLSGIYLSVWSNPNGHAVIFMVFLICALFPITSSPGFNLSLIASAAIAFSISAVLYKNPSEWIMDLLNLLTVVPVAVASNWYISLYKMSATVNEIRLEEERGNYRDESTIDELTQLKNRQNFMQTLQRCLVTTRFDDKFLCLAIIDIDYFKQYNDYYGHLQGDECLRSIGEALSNLQKTGIYAARIGGEEFALLWFEKDKNRAKDTALIAQQNIWSLKIPHKTSEISSYITVSIGVQVTLCDAHNNTLMIYNAADKALYEAKERGRNGIVVYGGDEKTYIPGKPKI